jgi:8-oxo-dGTP diphosphatase
MAATYCSECGTRLEQRFVFGRERGVCPNCGHVDFVDPKVGVGVVFEMDGGIVLAQRGHEPMLGGWSFPSGFVDAGEVLEDAAKREVEEETGLQVSIDSLLGAYSTTGERTIFVAYAGTLTGGELCVGEECQDVRAFPLGQLPELAFPHDGEIIEAWVAARARQEKHS